MTDQPVDLDGILDGMVDGDRLVVEREAGEMTWRIEHVMPCGHGRWGTENPFVAPEGAVLRCNDCLRRFRASDRSEITTDA